MPPSFFPSFFLRDRWAFIDTVYNNGKMTWADLTVTRRKPSKYLGGVWLNRLQTFMYMK